MRQIIGAFGILFIMMANIFICTGLIGASGQVAAAKEYKSQVVAELENSNFNPGVIDACKRRRQRTDMNWRFRIVFMTHGKI